MASRPGAAGWDAHLVKTTRKVSQYSGRRYARYTPGYWRRYRRQRKFRFRRAVYNLNRLLDGRPDPYRVHEPGTPGRPPVPPKTVLMALMVKALLDLSYRDAESFLLWAVGGTGLMDWVPAPSTMQERAGDIPRWYLERMILDAIPTLERSGVVLLVDATGLSTRLYGRWRSARTATKKVKRRYVKMHLLVDLDRKVVLMGCATKGWKGDGPFGRRLLKRVKAPLRRAGVAVDLLLGDTAYCSRETATLVESLDAEPVLKPRADATRKMLGHPAWARMVRRQRADPDAWMARYCYRVVIEGVIGAIKATFGGTIRSKKRHHQDVEVLCRLVLWNCMRME